MQAFFDAVSEWFTGLFSGGAASNPLEFLQTLLASICDLFTGIV